MSNPFQVSTATLLANRAGQEPNSNYSLATGFHVYADLSLSLPLSAAEDDKNAVRYLDLLQDYASIADVCAKQVGAHLLEIQQGDRIHLLMPEDTLTVDAFKRLFAFCISFTQTVYAKIKPKAGSEWGGFAMAADFGPAVLVGSDCGGGSLISLGNAANRPAKRLGKTPAVQSGHCAIRRDLLKGAFTVAGAAEWVEINVLEPKDAVATYANPVLTEKMAALAEGIVENRRVSNPIAFARASVFENPETSNVKSPVRVRGVCMRSDLDGFTKQVEEAFAAGPQAIQQLVVRFQLILNYPRQFIATLGRPCIETPWAGDCVPIILLTRDGEPIGDARKYLPVTAALSWHGQQEIEDTLKVRWSARLGAAKWVVGVACGDDEEGADGVLLVANLETSGRRFRVVAGWGARRALDAQEADGAKAEDTVLPNVDYSNLDSVYRESFTMLDSRFMRSPYKKLKEAASSRREGLSKATSFAVAGVTTRVVPQAKPFGE